MHLGSHALTYLQKAIHLCVFIAQRDVFVQIVPSTDINLLIVKGPWPAQEISVTYYTKLIQRPAVSKTMPLPVVPC